MLLAKCSQEEYPRRGEGQLEMGASVHSKGSTQEYQAQGQADLGKEGLHVESTAEAGTAESLMLCIGSEYSSQNLVLTMVTVFRYRT